MSVAPEPDLDVSPRAIVSDMIDLMAELADVLAANAAGGDFGRHEPWLRQADDLMHRLSSAVDPMILHLHEREMRTVIERLRAAFMLIDVQGRA